MCHLAAARGAVPHDKLVSEAVPKETVGWSAEEKKVMQLVTKAWLLLAPLGVEIADIRRLIDKAVRNAWK